jgi:mevalonate kinase
MTVTASAPGKLMLFGEHAVLYNHPCLVTAVDIRVAVTASTTPTDDLHIETHGQPAVEGARRVPIDAVLGSREFLDPRTAFVEAAVRQVFTRYRVQTGLRIDTQGPAMSYGLGSSSAVTVAALAALIELLGFQVDRFELFKLAHAAVLAVQGSASGFDVASAIFGGTLWFVTGGPEIEPLTVPDLPVVIGYSGAKVSTTRWVDRVAELHARQTALVDSILETIEGITRAARAKLVDGDWEAVGELMNLNQGLLDALGVNVPQLAAPIFAAREAGACGAKLSGAGGGDCMVALAGRDRHPAIKQALEAAGTQVVEAAPNAEGVRIERG